MQGSKNGLLNISFLLLLVLLPTMISAAELALPELIDTVLQNNPAIKTAQQKSIAAEAFIKQRTALPDPKLAYQSGNQNISLTQELKNPGMLNAENKAAQAEAAIANLQYQAVRRELIEQTSSFYYRLYAVDRVLALTAREKNILQVMYDSSIKLYQTGKADQQEPLNISLMLSELTAKEYQLYQEQLSLQAGLKRLTGGQNVALSFTEEITIPKFTQELETLQQTARITGNLDVLMAVRELEKSKSERERVNFLNLPEFEIGVGSSAGMGADVMAGVSLPLWLDKNQAGYAYQDAVQLAASNNYQTALLDNDYGVADLFYKLKAAEQTIDLYDHESLPRAKQAVTVSRAAYQAGKANFAQWLITEQKFLETSIMYYRMQADQGMYLAELEKITGLVKE